LDVEWKCSLETYTLLRGKALADYQGKYKPEVNWAGVSTCGTAMPELSIALCTFWDCLTSCDKVHGRNVFPAGWTCKRGRKRSSLALNGGPGYEPGCQFHTQSHDSGFLFLLDSATVFPP